MPDYANVLVKVVAILGVIKRVPATTPSNNVFCYSAVAHIVTPLVNLAFRSKSGFKNICRTRAGFSLVILHVHRMFATFNQPKTQRDNEDVVFF